MVQSANAGITGVYSGEHEKTLPAWTHDILVSDVHIRNPNQRLLEYQNSFESAAKWLSIFVLAAAAVFKIFFQKYFEIFS